MAPVEIKEAGESVEERVLKSVRCPRVEPLSLPLRSSMF